MFKYQEVKMLIRIWWMNLFSQHKLTPRFRRKTIDKTPEIKKHKDIEVLRLEDMYE